MSNFCIIDLLCVISWLHFFYCRVQSSVLPAATQRIKGLEESGIEGEICVLMEFSSCSSTADASYLNQRYVHTCVSILFPYISYISVSLLTKFGAAN